MQITKRDFTGSNPSMPYGQNSLLYVPRLLLLLPSCLHMSSPNSKRQRGAAAEPTADPIVAALKRPKVSIRRAEASSWLAVLARLANHTAEIVKIARGQEQDDRFGS
jgi:hypothetical protein